MEERLLHHSYDYAFDQNQLELLGNQIPLPPSNTMISRVGSSSSAAAAAAAFCATEACMGFSSYDLQENDTKFSSFDRVGMIFQQPSYSYHHPPQISRNSLIPSGLYRNDLSEKDHLLILEEKLLGDAGDTNMISPSPTCDPFHDFRVSLSRISLILHLLLLYLMIISPLLSLYICICRPHRILLHPILAA